MRHYLPQAHPACRTKSAPDLSQPLTQTPVRARPANAMVLAAGLGKRMLPITATMPKPLVKVAGQSLIDFALDRLREAGMESVVVNVHHFADMLEAHLRTPRDAARSSSPMSASELLETGGGVKKALPLFGERSLHHLQLRLALDRGAAAEPEAPGRGLGPGAHGHPDARGARRHEHRLRGPRRFHHGRGRPSAPPRERDSRALRLCGRRHREAGARCTTRRTARSRPTSSTTAPSTRPPLRLAPGRAMAACWRAPGHRRGGEKCLAASDAM